MAKASNSKKPAKTEVPSIEEFDSMKPNMKEESFDDWLQSASNEKEAEAVTTGAFRGITPLYNNSLVKLAVMSVNPIKSEVEDVKTEISDLNQDVRTLVPWMAGISMQVMILKIRNIIPDPKGTGENVFENAELFKYDEETGLFSFPYDFKTIRQYESIRARDINEGRVRVYSLDTHHSEKATFPTNWETMTPRERFMFWSVVLGRKFGLKAPVPGMTFYAYTSRVEKEYNGQKRRFTNFYKTMRDDVTKQTYEASWEVGRMDLDLLTRLNDQISAEWEREMAARDATTMAANSQGGYWTGMDTSDIPF